MYGRCRKSGACYQQRGLTNAEVLLLASVGSFVGGAIEVPTGMIADRIGNLKAVQLGSLLSLLSSIGFHSLNGFWPLLLSDLVGVVGSSLISGSAELLSAERWPGGLGQAVIARGRLSAIMSLIFIPLGGWLGTHASGVVVLGNIIATTIICLCRPRRVTNRREIKKSQPSVWTYDWALVVKTLYLGALLGIQSASFYLQVPILLAGDWRLEHIGALLGFCALIPTFVPLPEKGPFLVIQGVLLPVHQVGPISSSGPLFCAPHVPLYVPVLENDPSSTLTQPEKRVFLRRSPCR